MLLKIIIFMFFLSIQFECIADESLFEKYEKYPQLLLSEKYEQLTKELELVFKDYESKKISDNEMDNVLRAFDRREQGVEKKFKQWVKKSKGSYIPRMLRGVFYNKEGWRERGSKWSNETDKRQFIELRSKQYKAVKDFKYVIKMNKNYPHAYAYAINSYRSVGKTEELERLYARFNKIDPANLIVKMAYIKSLTPRWGGSYELMQEVIDSSEPYIKKNPELNVIRGRVYSEMSYDLRHPKDIILTKINRQKLELINKALKYGDYAQYYLDKAYILKKSLKYKLAYEAATKALSLRPHDTAPYYLRLSLAKRLYNEKLIYTNAIMLLKMNVNKTYNTFLAGLALYGLGQYKESIEYLNRSLEFPDSEDYRDRVLKYINLSKQKLL